MTPCSKIASRQSLGSDMIDEMLAPAKLAIFVFMYPIFNLILVRVSPRLLQPGTLDARITSSLHSRADLRVAWAGEPSGGRHERSVGLSVLQVDGRRVFHTSASLPFTPLRRA